VEENMDLNGFSEILKVLLQIANVVVLGYALYKFLNKPHDTLETKVEELSQQVDELNIKLKEVNESLHHGNDKFRQQEDINSTFKSVMLSFVNFEIAYCLHTNYPNTEELMEAKTELESYLTGKRHEKKNWD
jgi:hypothetical protein